MKRNVLFIIMTALLANANVWAQEGSLARMETTAETARLYLQWEGSGTITANGLTAESSGLYSFPVVEGKVELITAGDVTLTQMRCHDNKLTSLDVTNCTALTHLRCESNQLTELDLSNCVALWSLWCGSNQITNLDLTECPVLYELRAFHQRITLPQATITDGVLSVENPITFNGNMVTYITGATYHNGNIIWSELTGTNGNAEFRFAVEPSGYDGGYDGTVVLPWISKEVSIEDVHYVAAPQIRSGNGQVYVVLPETSNVQIISLTGAIIYQAQLAAGTHSIALGAGVYIAKIGNVIKKVMIRN